MSTSEVIKIFRKARTQYKNIISSESPVLPLEGELYNLSYGQMTCNGIKRKRNKGEH